MTSFQQACIVGGASNRPPVIPAGAMHGVYGLMGLDLEVPPIYHGIADPKVALASLRTLMG
jgi:oleate hydratase